MIIRYFILIPGESARDGIAGLQTVRTDARTVHCLEVLMLQISENRLPVSAAIGKKLKR